MCKFKYKLFDKLYLKERCADIPLGSDITIISRVQKNGVNYYTVAEGTMCIDETDNIAYDVCEDLISSRPPFQMLYRVSGEVLMHKLPTFKVEQLVAGNLEEAKKHFDLAVRVCEAEFNNLGRYGKCVLYELDFDDKGVPVPLTLVPDENIIKQKFFIDRG